MRKLSREDVAIYILVFIYALAACFLIDLAFGG